MNFNFMLAGSASTNPVLLLIAIGLIQAWKIAGLIGLDYILLPLVGAPWNRGHHDASSEEAGIALRKQHAGG
jgi:thiosulfate dehydrogenase (quinone) large subunit